MAKIRLWNQQRGHDYNFIDKQVREVIGMGGTGIYVHKYMGPKVADGTITTIQDVVFLENRSRRYEETIYELTGHYNPENGDFDLSQFGLFLSNDTIFVEFHTNDMVDRIGRKLMAGDVLEMPHLREYFTLTESNPAYNKYFVIEDAYRSQGGYSPTWHSHIWRVKAKAVTGGEEFEDILGKASTGVPVDADGNVGTAQPQDSLMDILSSSKTDQEITAAIVAEAECDMPYDAPFYNGAHYYIHDDANGIPMVYWHTGDGVPPNGAALKGSGTEFPDDIANGEYFLRTDFKPFPYLFLKEGCKYIRIELDIRRCWTAQNQLLDSFIDNTDTYIESKGVVKKQRQALSKVVKPKDGE